MQPEVEYLGFKMNKQGVSPLKENIKAMQSVSKLKSISEMKSNEITPKSRKRDSLLFTQLRSFISMYTVDNSQFLPTISHY